MEPVEPILRGTQLRKRFSKEAGLFSRYGSFTEAVRGVDLVLNRGEAYGLVGESGCGKTTLARLLVGMYPMSRGNLELMDSSGHWQSLQNDQKKIWKWARSRIKYIFQDPARSLNPRMTVQLLLLSGYRYSPDWPGKKKAIEEARQVMTAVGLSPDDLNRRPSEFSGGQRQRISIARALIQKPEILICDEVVSALDVSIQSQILNLLLDLKKQYNLTLLFIAHDLTVTTYFCDRIGVMYQGLIMEEGPADDFIQNPLHPYTHLLYDSIPHRGLAGKTPPPVKSAYENSLGGCPFIPRCPISRHACYTLDMVLILRSNGHRTACPFSPEGTHE